MHDLQQWIKKCVGLDLHSYVNTNGHLTIGWGRNLEKGIRVDEAELMFKNDLAQTISELRDQPWFSNLPPDVRKALINMNFYLGITKLLEFKDMIAALETKDFTSASLALLKSDWAKKVHEKAIDIALMIREGK